MAAKKKTTAADSRKDRGTGRKAAGKASRTGAGSTRERSSYHHGDLRNALLEAGQALLKEVGPAGFSLRDVARRAKVSHMAPYRHFENRNALLAALAVQGFQELRDEMRAAAAEYPDDPRRQLTSSGVRYVRLAAGDPARLMLMFGGVLTPEDYSEEQRTVTREAFDGLVHIIQSGQAAGVFRAGDPMTLSVAAWSLVHGLAMLLGTGHLRAFEEQEPDQEKLAAQINAIFAEGVLKREESV